MAGRAVLLWMTLRKARGASTRATGGTCHPHLAWILRVMHVLQCLLSKCVFFGDALRLIPINSVSLLDLSHLVHLSPCLRITTIIGRSIIPQGAAPLGPLCPKGSQGQGVSALFVCGDASGPGLHSQTLFFSEVLLIIYFLRVHTPSFHSLSMPSKRIE